jgi:hypothetical protein
MNAESEHRITKAISWILLPVLGIFFCIEVFFIVKDAIDGRFDIGLGIAAILTALFLPILKSKLTPGTK